MIKTHQDDAAFPLAEDFIGNQSGLTKLEYFSALFMAPLLPNSTSLVISAKVAVRAARNLIDELNEDQTPST